MGVGVRQHEGGADAALGAHGACTPAAGAATAVRAHASLQAEGKRVGCNRVTRLMHEHGIQAHRKRPLRKATDSNHDVLPAPNLLAREFSSATAPNQVWLAGMTYIATGEGWLYLAAVLDLFSRGARRGASV